ncbi:MAG: peptidoglycan DD-metalloendopeptidase family protein [Cellvibrionales bacterium]|nr:peptidoglycan DD-metalloendopeptidase family protein [Cellvibrionales bacterium]
MIKNLPHKARNAARPARACVILLAILAGCATSNTVPVEERAPPPSRLINTHRVEAGDTLHSIAWRYERDIDQLARINALKPPFTLQRGQQIQLGPAGRGAARSGERRVAARPAQSAPPPSIPSAPPPSAAPAAPASWVWPVPGSVIKPFNRSGLTKGIILATAPAQRVVAAAAGTVVYAGTGVRGYGNFLIIKHSDLFLSAYAHNSQLLVGEGATVRRGQEIAVSGKDAEGNPRLYFEIRKDGRPVDPVKYLPKRNAPPG